MASPPPQQAHHHASLSQWFHATQVVANVDSAAYFREPHCRYLATGKVLFKPATLAASALAQEDVPVTLICSDLQIARLAAECLPRMWFVHLDSSC
jgi:hypothetical protein